MGSKGIDPTRSQPKGINLNRQRREQLNHRKEAKIGKYIEGISNRDYHADKDFLSSSMIKKAVESHANFRWLTNFKQESEDKWDANNAKDFGSLVHTMVLEPEMTDKEFAFMDLEGRNMRLKENQRYKALFLEMNSHKMVLTNEARERARICEAAILEHPFLRKLLEADGKPELSGYYRDDFYRRELRFRPDKLIPNFEGKDVILDLKTCRDIETFVKEAKFKWHYDLSANMYCTGHHKITGNMPDFYFGVVESQPPYRVAVYKTSDDFLTMGKKKYAKAMVNIDLAMGAKPEHIMWQDAQWEMI
jgi:hypothetical protein